MFIYDAIDGYTLALQASRASPATVRLYTYMLRRAAEFARGMGRTRIDELTVDVARGAVAATMTMDSVRGPGWKGGDGTAHSMVCALRAFSKALRADGVPIADFDVLRFPRVIERIQPRTTPEEFRALEGAVLRRLMTGQSPRLLVARDLALLSFMADTGLRAAELCRLNVEDLDLEQGAVTVHQGKGGKSRVLSIRDDDPAERDGGPTIRALRDYLAYLAQTFAGGRRQRALWVSTRGTRMTPSSLRAMLSRLCEDAGIDGNRPPHAFRRGYFSAEYGSRPTALPVLRARMGWSPKSHHMVEVYTRGADIDLAREQAQPSVSKRWRAGPKRTSTGRGARPIVPWDAGPERVELDRAAPPRRGRMDGNRPAGQPAKGPALSRYQPEPSHRIGETS